MARGVGRCGRYKFVWLWFLNGRRGCCAQRIADGTPSAHKGGSGGGGVKIGSKKDKVITKDKC